MKLRREDLLLYAVTDRSWLKEGETLYDQVEQALKGGVTMVQLREKKLDREAFLKEAEEIQKLCLAYHVPFLINDAVDIALEIGADGVHVGQSDMEAKKVRKLLGDDRIIGVTAAAPALAKLAEQNGADYLGSGAVFGTSTKTDAKPLEHDVLKEICRSVTIPVAAIGGITKENVLKLKGTGISGIAVVSAVFAEPDIEEATRRLKLLAGQAVGTWKI